MTSENWLHIDHICLVHLRLDLWRFVFFRDKFTAVINHLSYNFKVVLLLQLYLHFLEFLLLNYVLLY